MFNKDFLWGVATASYQIEGAAYKDNKGLSIWDTFSKQEGKVYGEHNGDVACDAYHRIKEDVLLLKELGVKVYRFSISWTRIIPQGVGAVNEIGLQYYETLIDELLNAGIEPYVTLFHWDYPLALQHMGAWLNDESANWFEKYTEVVLKRLGKKVTKWMTLNEPQCFIGLGYYLGVHAPGYQYSLDEIVKMSHNVFLAHGKAVKVIRNIVGEQANIGFAFVPTVAIPNTNTKDDIEAAKAFTFDKYNKVGLNQGTGFIFDTDFWFDPIMLGKYPDWIMENYRSALPDDDILKNDLECISEEVDYIGINMYQAARVEKDGDDIKVVQGEVGHPITAFNWAISEEMMYWGPKFLYERYHKPIIITENGLSSRDWIALDNKVHDEGRIDFLQRYLNELERAFKEGIDIKGYFQWSFLDNFEWAEGYKERFGMVYVDFQTGKRTPKASYYWYQNLIK